MLNVRAGLVIGGAVLALVGLMSAPSLLFASDQPLAKDIIQRTGVQCHRLEGKPDSRFNLMAPILFLRLPVRSRRGRHSTSRLCSPLLVRCAMENRVTERESWVPR